LRHQIHTLLTTDVCGGVWDFTRILADELTRAGHRITLLAFGEPSPWQQRQAEQLGVELIAKPLRLEWMRDSAADVRLARELTEQLVQALRPDILHANQYALGDLRVDVPIVLTAHSDVLSWRKWTLQQGRECAIPIEWTYYAALVRHGLRSADAVVAVSKFLAAEIRALYRLERRIEVIYNGWLRDGSVPRAVGERSHLTLLAGRAWDEAKNLSLAAAAARDWQHGRIVLAGELRHPESGNQPHFGPPIETLGRISGEAIDRYLDQARVYLAPARYEPFGLLPLQAALAGCPLLLSDIPPFRELWDGAALFFRSDSAADLRRQWIRLLEDDLLATRLASAARRRARERFSSTRLAGEYLDLYESLLAGRGRALQDRKQRVQA
jgi:glycogen synthase